MRAAAWWGISRPAAAQVRYQVVEQIVDLDKLLAQLKQQARSRTRARRRKGAHARGRAGTGRALAASGGPRAGGGAAGRGGSGLSPCRWRGRRLLAAVTT